MEPRDIIFICIMALVYWLALITLPAYLIKRAMAQVVGIFRAQGATEARSARTIDDLGLRAPGVMERIGKARDYKPIALDMLRNAGVIVKTFDKRLYLSETELRTLCEQDSQNRLGLHALVRE